MRRADRCVTDLNQIHKVISRAEVCRIALVDGTMPYIVPMSFGFDGTHIYIHSAREGKKIDLLKINPAVCIEIEEKVEVLRSEKPCNWSARYFSVICNGIAELITEASHKSYGLNQIIRQYNPAAQDYPFTEEELAPVLVYKIELTEVTGKVSGINSKSTR